MNIQLQLMKVYSNRFLQTPEEISEFEVALEQLISGGDTSLISDLCKVFEDGTENHEVMFSLVHSVEFLYKKNLEEGLKLIAIAVPKVIFNAKEWMEVIHYRILNHPEVRLVYGKVLSKIDLSIRLQIIDLLNDIKNEDPDMFGNSVDEVMMKI
ncbi:Imm30 family immunity protein [Alkalihalobacillus sp. R86527]|uniref:Imm30 family immunity protein n=1 Tax=Alkalihalobacillus sp. R86527 TaxID=3093863 RepID=UPI00366FBC8A